MASAGLELFTIPPTDFRFEARREIHYQPVFPGVQPITFSIPASDDYVDLKELKLVIRVRLTDPAAAHQGIIIQGYPISVGRQQYTQLCCGEQFCSLQLLTNRSQAQWNFDGRTNQPVPLPGLHTDAAYP